MTAASVPNVPCRCFRKHNNSQLVNSTYTTQRQCLQRASGKWNRVAVGGQRAVEDLVELPRKRKKKNKETPKVYLVGLYIDALETLHEGLRGCFALQYNTDMSSFAIHISFDDS